MLEQAEIIFTFIFKYVSTLTGETFWSAILGALIGAQASYSVQKRAVKLAKVEREKSEMDRKRQLALSLLIKIINIHSEFGALKNHVDAAEQKAKKENPPVSIEVTLFPFANLSENICFSHEELTLLIQIESHDLFNKIFLLDKKLNSCLKLWRRYEAARQAVSDNSETNLNLDTGSMDIKFKTTSRAAPHYYIAKQIAPELATQTRLGFEESQSCIAEFQKDIREKLDIRQTIRFEKSG